MGDGGVLNITAAAWTAGFQWWRSGDITRTQNVSEYMLVFALCLVNHSLVINTTADSDLSGYTSVVSNESPTTHVVDVFVILLYAFTLIVITNSG